MQYFSNDFKFTAILCSEDHCPDDLVETGEVQDLTPDEIEKWLENGDLNAALLLGSVDRVFDGRYDVPIFVAHTANPDFYYASNWPPREPDDVIVEGECLSETLREATIEYYE